MINQEAISEIKKQRILDQVRDELKKVRGYTPQGEIVNVL